MLIRQDVATRTLARASPGKFVELLVQALQFLDTSTYEKRTAVDEFLRNAETRAINLDEGLRVCTTRIGRAMYTLRNKRGIAHKNDLDPTLYDLQFLLHSSQWVLGELIRVVAGADPQAANRLVAN